MDIKIIFLKLKILKYLVIDLFYFYCRVFIVCVNNYLIYMYNCIYIVLKMLELIFVFLDVGVDDGYFNDIRYVVYRIIYDLFGIER